MHVIAAGMTGTPDGVRLNPRKCAYVSPENFMELTGWLSGVDFGGEFGNAC